MKSPKFISVGVLFSLVFSMAFMGKPDKSYQEWCSYTLLQKDSLSRLKGEEEKFRGASSLLLEVLSDHIFPQWYGTPWDFNGTSNRPGQGEIACGYFVSTTLQHLGFNLNRYKTAQQAAAVIIKAISGTSKTYQDQKAMLTELQKGKDQLFIVGLDFHVGFLLIENHEAYFIHSDYFLGEVVREKANESQGFAATNAYVLGTITENKALLIKWMDNTRIYG